LSAHKTSQVEEFLKRNPNAKLHFTPTYSSWLNQVEIWFARLEREVIARGIFASVQDLSRSSCATYAPIQKPHVPSNGNTPMFDGESSHANEIAATGH
jgi:hypothetical protein